MTNETSEGKTLQMYTQESTDNDHLPHQKTYGQSKLLFLDENIQSHLSAMQLRISSRELEMQQDVTFLTGYIIGIFTLCHFIDISTVVDFTVHDYLMTSYKRSNETYIMGNDKIGVELKFHEYSILDFYFSKVRPIYNGIKGCKCEIGVLDSKQNDKYMMSTQVRRNQ